MKNKVMEAISNLKEKFPEVENLLKYKIDVKSDEEVEIALAGFDMDERKFVVNEIVIDDIPTLNACLVFNARMSDYIDEIEQIACESKKFLMMVAANFKINDELREFVGDNFKIHEEACLDKGYEGMSFEDILADVTVKYSHFFEDDEA